MGDRLTSATKAARRTRIGQLKRQGLSSKVIATRLGVSQTVVSEALKALGLTTKTRIHTTLAEV